MGKKGLVLHIGSHKTGSTAIQLFSTQYSQELNALGLLYPKTGRPPVPDISSGHHLLPWDISSQMQDSEDFWGAYYNNSESLWCDLVEEICADSATHTVLLSSEEFDTLTEKQISQLAYRLRDLHVEVVCYLRRLDQFLAAMYFTNVVYNQEKREINEYARTIRTPLSYVALFTRWANVFGCENVSMRCYDVDAFPENDVIIDFFDVLRINVRDIRRKFPSYRINFSSPWNVVATARLLNHMSAPREIANHLVRIGQTIYREKRSDVSLLRPSERADLVRQGLSDLETLKSSGAILTIPESFFGKDIPSSDTEWETACASPYSGLASLLSDIESYVSAQGAINPRSPAVTR